MHFPFWAKSRGTSVPRCGKASLLHSSVLLHACFVSFSCWDVCARFLKTGEVFCPSSFMTEWNKLGKCSSLSLHLFNFFNKNIFFLSEVNERWYSFRIEPRVCMWYITSLVVIFSHFEPTLLYRLRALATLLYLTAMWKWKIWPLYVGFMRHCV